MKTKRMRASTTIQQRAKELRQIMTSVEGILWERLRSRQVAGLRFRRQHPIGACIVDFYGAAARLVIEVDGSIHHLQVEEDLEKVLYNIFVHSPTVL
jgi:very-short-patch-repair endonuclease